MQESTIMMERLTIEETDLVSFSIQSSKEGIFLILEIKTVSEYGLDKIKKIKMDLDKFTEAVARSRAGTEGPNAIDMPPAGFDNSIRKLLAAFERTEWED